MLEISQLRGAKEFYAGYAIVSNGGSEAFDSSQPNSIQNLSAPYREHEAQSVKRPVSRESMERWMMKLVRYSILLNLFTTCMAAAILVLYLLK